MEIITRAEARERGLKRFFTGTPCKNGHISESNVASGVCLVCAKEKAKSARVKDPEKFRARKRSAYAENPEKFREEQRKIRANSHGLLAEQARRRRASNPEKFRLQQRVWRSMNRDAVLSRQRLARLSDPERFRNYDRNWNAANPAKVRKKAAKRRAAELRAVPSWFGELVLWYGLRLQTSFSCDSMQLAYAGTPITCLLYVRALYADYTLGIIAKLFPHP